MNGRALSVLLRGKGGAGGSKLMPSSKDDRQVLPDRKVKGGKKVRISAFPSGALELEAPDDIRNQ